MKWLKAICLNCYKQSLISLQSTKVLKFICFRIKQLAVKIFFFCFRINTNCDLRLKVQITSAFLFLWAPWWVMYSVLSSTQLSHIIFLFLTASLDHKHKPGQYKGRKVLPLSEIWSRRITVSKLNEVNASKTWRDCYTWVPTEWFRLRWRNETFLECALGWTRKGDPWKHLVPEKLISNFCHFVISSKIQSFAS